MSSKLISLARVIFLSKAVAARSVPAAIVGPLQRIFGSAEHEEDKEDEQQQEHEENGVVLEGDKTSIFSALVVAARAEATNGAVIPIDSPFAKRELQDFQTDYYRRAIANAQTEEPDPSEDPDLSIPVGDDYLYLAQ